MADFDRIRPTRNIAPVDRVFPIRERVPERDRKERKPRQSPDRETGGPDQEGPHHVDEFA